jgi:hypothetical protein
MLQDRLNTGDLLVRKNFHVEDPTCVLCDDDTLETLTHLFSRITLVKYSGGPLIEWNANLPFFAYAGIRKNKVHHCLLQGIIDPWMVGFRGIDLSMIIFRVS